MRAVRQLHATWPVAGPGSIDVIEIDAASHGGVDDARDLREKAFFAPVRSRYKVYIIDEAHMVTTQGFNALLKLVEEPPPHLRFIFATTEPEKVLPTIRSRTHHYPFRLIPPRLLSSYLTELCELEGVPIAQAALPLVVRAGAGSARDTLSVLDQLLGGAGPEGVTHALATGLLGYTPDSLLDEVVDAFAAGDGAAVFGVVDKVIETGQDPRRFTEDLLRRLRDLVIVAAVPDAPGDRAHRRQRGRRRAAGRPGRALRRHRAHPGRRPRGRGADRDARRDGAPLLLELICARVLLPGADHSTDGLTARLDRIEKRMSVSGVPASAPARPQTQVPGQDRPAPSSTTRAPEQVAEAPGGRRGRPVGDRPHRRPLHPSRCRPRPPGRPRRPRPPSSTTPQQPASPPAQQPAAPAAQEPVQERARPEPTPVQAPAAEPAAGALSLVDVRRLWPDIVEATKVRRRVTWIHLTQNAQVVAVDAKTLTLGFANAGARDSFDGNGSAEIVRQAAIDVVGSDWRIETIVDPGATPDSTPVVTRQAAAPPAPSPTQSPTQSTEQGAASAEQAPVAPQPPTSQVEAPAPPSAVERPPAWIDEAPPDDDPGEPGAPSAAADEVAPPPRPQAGPGSIAAARGAIQQTRVGGPDTSRSDGLREADADAHPDDLDVEDDPLAGAALLERELGARVIEEIRHQ